MSNDPLWNLWTLWSPNVKLTYTPTTTKKFYVESLADHVKLFHSNFEIGSILDSLVVSKH